MAMPVEKGFDHTVGLLAEDYRFLRNRFDDFGDQFSLRCN